MVLPFFTFFYGFSQDKNLDFHFENDSVTVERGTSFLNFLVLKNKSSQEINIENLKATEKYPGLLLSTPSQYKLTAGEKKRFPVKFLVNLDFMKMDSTEIEYSLTYTLNQQQQELETSFYVKKDQETRIALYPFSRENYINPSAEESTVAVFVENRGYQSRSVQLTAQSTSAGLELAPEKVQISLESQEKRLVEFKVNLRNSTKFYPDYNIRVKATDLKDNKEVASTYLRIEVLSNQKQLLPRRGLETGKNFVEMAYNQQSSSFNYLQLQSNTEFEIGENFQGRFNTTGNYYLKENKYNFYDTWFELEKKGYRLRLGNVYGNEYDYNVTGRGGKLNAVLGDYKEIEVLVVENNYNLFGNYFPQHQSATIAGAKYEFGKADHHNGKISYVYEHDPRLNIDAQVAHATSYFVVDSIHNFNAEAGLSHEKGLITKDENIGFSTGLNYSTKIKNWDFQSLNSWAGKNYAGLNRGAFDFNQQVGYRFSHKARIFGQYQNAQVHPEYLDFQDSENINNPNYNRYYYYSTQSAQTGVQLSIAKWHFLLSPKFELQKNSNNFMTEELLAYRFHTTIGTSFNNQSINLSALYSHAKAKSKEEWFNSLKTTLSYSYQAFSLNGSVEINPQNVIDLRSYDVNDENFVNYNIYTAYSFQAFHNSLNGSLSAGINYSE
ncbi:MAG TPA: hypothetical protein VK021_12635, partial [Flavobacteriaceae bacterium]|nr:hypothetical protein [Flavobacteriaceae bacterium]